MRLFPASQEFAVTDGPGKLQAALMRRLVLPMKRYLLSSEIAHAKHEVTVVNDPFFDKLGVSQSAAWALVADILAPLGRAVDPKIMSIQYACFAALKLSGFKPKAVLELGTAVADTTQFLSRLFSDSEIVTVDLPLDDPIYQMALAPAETAHERRKQENLNQPNINAMRMNSLHILSAELPKFDLIWIDASHRYPEIAWDHFYAFHTVQPGGWVFSDDVQPMLKSGRRIKTASHAEEVLAYLNDRFPGTIDLLLKRQDAEKYVLAPKYIAAYQKPKEK